MKLSKIKKDININFARNLKSEEKQVIERKDYCIEYKVYMGV